VHLYVQLTGACADRDFNCNQLFLDADLLQNFLWPADRHCPNAKAAALTKFSVWIHITNGLVKSLFTAYLENCGPMYTTTQVAWRWLGCWICDPQVWFQTDPPHVTTLKLTGHWLSLAVFSISHELIPDCQLPQLKSWNVILRARGNLIVTFLMGLRLDHLQATSRNQDYLLIQCIHQISVISLPFKYMKDVSVHTATVSGEHLHTNVTPKMTFTIEFVP